ncbi:MarR family transcriptional regulator [Natrinema pallidum]|nr:MarR family transcriptional regulator [Natrinema pallidum]
MQGSPISEQMNADYEPTDDDEKVLEVMKSEPCGRVNPYLVREETELSKQRVSNSFRQLVASGWVEKRTRALYDLVNDPREN